MKLFKEIKLLGQIRSILIVTNLIGHQILHFLEKNSLTLPLMYAIDFPNDIQ